MRQSVACCLVRVNPVKPQVKQAQQSFLLLKEHFLPLSIHLFATSSSWPRRREGRPCFLCCYYDESYCWCVTNPLCLLDERGRSRDRAAATVTVLTSRCYVPSVDCRYGLELRTGRGSAWFSSTSAARPMVCSRIALYLASMSLSRDTASSYSCLLAPGRCMTLPEQEAWGYSGTAVAGWNQLFPVRGTYSRRRLSWLCSF